ncbi:hypothetical protein [Kribbella yunnanensis]|uniref:hypothetical protein n=1 Tax=Kribbella yunnanensis TaxID=190194 RepID=UPI0031E42C53
MDIEEGPSGPDERPAVWSVARAIELLDRAIDAVGVQLMRSEGLRFDWTDDSAVLLPRPGRARRSRAPGVSADDVEQEVRQGIEPP